ncbi:MAG: DUF2909 family protein [Pseudomonadales bacterium]
MKIIILLLFVATLIALGLSFYHLMRGRENKHTSVNFLVLRLVFTLTLLAYLIYGFVTGNITPHGL